MAFLGIANSSKAQSWSRHVAQPQFARDSYPEPQGRLSWQILKKKTLGKNLTGDQKSKVTLLCTFNLLILHRSWYQKRPLWKTIVCPQSLSKYCTWETKIFGICSFHLIQLLWNFSPVKGFICPSLGHWVSIRPTACRISLLMGVDNASKELRQIGQRLPQRGSGDHRFQVLGWCWRWKICCQSKELSIKFHRI